MLFLDKVASKQIFLYDFLKDFQVLQDQLQLFAYYFWVK
jgi:hypothetical protein